VQWEVCASHTQPSKLLQSLPVQLAGSVTTSSVTQKKINTNTTTWVSSAQQFHSQQDYCFYKQPSFCVSTSDESKLFQIQILPTSWKMNIQMVRNKL
jgi:16S rRNA U516 pseudouridylate synthase RsuA-like enzyme